MGVKKAAGGRLASALLLTVALAVQMAGGAAYPALAEDAVPGPASPGGYQAYLDTYKDGAMAGTEITLPAASYTAAEMEGLRVETDYKGKEGPSLMTAGTGFVDYAFTVEKEGFYHIGLSYYPLAGTTGAVTRTILLDGALPYEEASGVELSRAWSNQGEIGQDAAGNDIRPIQVESPKWMEQDLRDAAGYYNEPLRFYLTAGAHVLRLQSDKEPVALHTIRIHGGEAAPAYAEALAQWKREGAAPAGKSLFIEAEAADYKSDQTLYPLNDRTSPNSTPYDHKCVKYNTIGADHWQMPGQWLEWDIEVPEDGLYAIAMRFKQDTKANNVSSRRLTIDGRLPFAEAAQLTFPYSSAWQLLPLGAQSRDEEGYQFYLTKGRHTLRLEVTLGGFASIVKEVDDVMRQLNTIYRHIVMFTGPDPDVYRDYQFDVSVPGLLEDMAKESARLKEIEGWIAAISKGKSGANTAALQRLYVQLDGMVKDESTISYRLQDFRNNISSLGTWVLGEKAQPLQVDSFTLTAPGETLPRAEANVFGVIKHYTLQFIDSFFVDYTRIGQSDLETDRTITVWLGSSANATSGSSASSSSATTATAGNAAGRDQAQIIKQMINDGFTTDKKIGVNLQLVSIGALLPATLANIGPDVALQQVQTEPINYALRNAVYNLAEFEDAQEIKTRFYESALEPFTYQNGLYALPETQTFPMLFYRRDILEEMDIPVSALDTWDSLLRSVLPKIQKSYLMFGVPTTLNNYAIWLYQEGGTLYENGGLTTGLDSQAGIKAFEKFTELYTDYKQPIAFDFANRFRTGEMPIGIADLTTYNQLSVFAPEIRGLWDVRVVPGTPVTREDGSVAVDHAAAGTVTGGVIMAQSREKEAAWEFLKWWTEAGTQSRYGQELESVMGTAARYPTANVEAMKSIAWEPGTQQAINEQWLFHPPVLRFRVP